MYIIFDKLGTHLTCQLLWFCILWSIVMTIAVLIFMTDKNRRRLKFEKRLTGLEREIQNRRTELIAWYDAKLQNLDSEGNIKESIQSIITELTHKKDEAEFCRDF